MLRRSALAALALTAAVPSVAHARAADHLFYFKVTAIDLSYQYSFTDSAADIVYGQSYDLSLKPAKKPLPYLAVNAPDGGYKQTAGLTLPNLEPTVKTTGAGCDHTGTALNEVIEGGGTTSKLKVSKGHATGSLALQGAVDDARPCHGVVSARSMGLKSSLDLDFAVKDLRAKRTITIPIKASDGATKGTQNGSWTYAGSIKLTRVGACEGTNANTVNACIDKAEKALGQR